MFNKTKTIKLFVFSIVIFTLLINIIWLGYTEYCRNYVDYNNEIVSILNNNHKTTIEEYKEACLKLKPDTLVPFNDILSSWSVLMILTSTAITIIVIDGSVIFRKKIFSKKESFVLLSAILLSFIIILHISLIELNFYYWIWGCSRFLL